MKAHVFVFLIGLAIVACTPLTNPDANPNSSEGSIQLVSLDSLNRSLLDDIFCDDNLKLSVLNEDSVYVISSTEELLNVCPDYVETLPTIDFSTSCIVFTYIERPSISDKIVSIDLVKEDNLKFIVTINKAEAGWTAVGQFYPYGVYKMSYSGEPISLQKIIL